VRVDAVSLAIVARGVVASLDEAEMISGAARGSPGPTAATGVLCTDDSGFGASVAIAPGIDRLGVGGSECLSRVNRGEGATLPALRDGRVLLRCTLPAGVTVLGVTGVGPISDRLLCLLDTDTFRLRLFNLPPASVLAFELERPTTVLDLFGVVGEDGGFAGLDTPLCTSFTVS